MTEPMRPKVGTLLTFDTEGHQVAGIVAEHSRNGCVLRLFNELGTRLDVALPHKSVTLLGQRQQDPEDPAQQPGADGFGGSGGPAQP